MGVICQRVGQYDGLHTSLRVSSVWGENFEVESAEYGRAIRLLPEYPSR